MYASGEKYEIVGQKTARVKKGKGGKFDTT